MLGIPNRGLVVGALVALAGLAAGCGGGSSQPTTGGVKGTAKTAGPPSATFSVADVAGVGKVLVDGRGRTVYILTADGRTNLPCTDASGCTNSWPDLPLRSGTAAARAGMGLDASLLGTKKLADGETYPTYNGWLMYEFTGDSASGQANGEGLQSFGGTWYALDASGNPVKSSAGSGGSGGGGGGY